MKKFQYILEMILVKAMMTLFSAMSFETASNIGGWLGKFIGKKLKVNKTARKNIKLAMPELPESRVEEILLGMWDNLGRIVTEYSHLAKMKDDKIRELIKTEGTKNLEYFAREEAGFLMAGHFGNWEMITAIPYLEKMNLHIVYRKANNPYVDKLILKIRERYKFSASAKGSVGARQIIQSLRQNKKILMLVDQKQNDGISVPFFGVPAMTAPAIANLSLKYDCNIYPARIIRVEKTKFRFVMYPPIHFIKTENERKDILNLMTKINSIIEEWVRETPEQWFWVHNRWPKDAFRRENDYNLY